MCYDNSFKLGIYTGYKLDIYNMFYSTGEFIHQSLDSHSHDITIDRPNELRNSSKRIKYIGGLKV